jgi:hypothetical protein
MDRNSTNGSITTRPPSVVGELVDEFSKKFSTEIMRLIEENFGKSNRQLTEKEQEEQQKLPICPECWSKRVKQIHRNSLEKALLSFTDHKAFYCRSCGYSFYAKLENGDGSRE